MDDFAGQRGRALAAVVPYLRCPVCAGGLRLTGGQLTCTRGHAFDIARHGYVNLISGRPGPGTADSTDMVAARDRFLGGGHYRRIADATAAVSARHDPAGPGLVIDLAGGTGYYLARVLETLRERDGVCVDLSAPALRRAARVHPRVAAVGADVWRPVPLADGCAAHVLSVFGPRNAAETSRLLVPGGTLTIAAPGADHLRELRECLGLIGIDQRKQHRIASAFRDYAQLDEAGVRFELELDHADLAALVAMGPSARHITPEKLAGRVNALPALVPVTVDVQVSAWRRPGTDESPSPDESPGPDGTRGQHETRQAPGYASPAGS
jgi:23S rRNA (guanine745-N1)-methyltransferase